MMMLQDNVIRYDTLVSKTVVDTDTVSFYRVVAIGKDYKSYFTVNHGMVTKVYVTERGDTFYNHDYYPSIGSLTFNVKLHNVKRSMEAHDTIKPCTISPIGDTRSASEFIELPQPVQSVPVKSDSSVICDAALIPIVAVVVGLYAVNSFKCWVEFGSKLKAVLNA
jgi:hypothetical protein